MYKKIAMNMDAMEKVSGGDYIVVPPFRQAPDMMPIIPGMPNPGGTPIIPGMPNPFADK